MCGYVGVWICKARHSKESAAREGVVRGPPKWGAVVCGKGAIPHAYPLMFQISPLRACGCVSGYSVELLCRTVSHSHLPPSPLIPLSIPPPSPPASPPPSSSLLPASPLTHARTHNEPKGSPSSAVMRMLPELEDGCLQHQGVRESANQKGDATMASRYRLGILTSPQSHLLEDVQDETAPIRAPQFCKNVLPQTIHILPQIATFSHSFATL